eukprot:6355912-Prymnesium_polylepis.1
MVSGGSGGRARSSCRATGRHRLPSQPIVLVCCAWAATCSCALLLVCLVCEGTSWVKRVRGASGLRSREMRCPAPRWRGMYSYESTCPAD